MKVELKYQDEKGAGITKYIEVGNGDAIDRALTKVRRPAILELEGDVVGEVIRQDGRWDWYYEGWLIGLEGDVTPNGTRT